MVAAHDAFGDFHAAHTRQMQVAQHYVRPQLADLGQCVFAGFGLTDHLDVRLMGQDHLHAGSHQRVVVHQIHSNRHPRTSSKRCKRGQA
jgi:hypothetical protein